MNAEKGQPVLLERMVFRVHFRFCFCLTVSVRVHLNFPSEMVAVRFMNDLSKRPVVITGLQEIKALNKGTLNIGQLLLIKYS